MPVRQESAGLVEDILTVGPPHHQTEQTLDLVVRKADSPPDVVLVRTDLTVDDVTQAQTAGHGPSGVLVLENLLGKVQASHDLEQAERNDGLHATRTRGP